MAADATRGSLVRGLSLLGIVALIVGNMVGTSIYTLPASLASTVGPLGIIAWVLTAIGYLGVALVYASLGTRYPRTGGPYVYAREAFGDFAGFQTVWLYWISTVLGNAGITIGVIAYVGGLVPALAASIPLELILGQLMLWGLCWLNVRGVKQSARVQIAIMMMNIVPLLGLTLLSARAFNSANLKPFAPQGWSSLAAGTALIVWAYSGVESATVPAGEVRSPERTTARGTMIGYAIATIVFLLTSIVVAGVLPNAVVASSARPIAMMALRGIGPWGASVISIGAIVAGTGTLNGWVLMSGRIPLSAAEDGLFFPGLARIHPRYGTPHVALIAGTAVASLTLCLICNHTLLKAFNFIVLLSVWTTLVPHLFAAAAELALSRRDPARYSPAARKRARVVGPLAFVAVMYFIYGSGAEVGQCGFLVMAAGTPLYVWFITQGSSGVPAPRTAERDPDSATGSLN